MHILIGVYNCKVHVWTLICQICVSEWISVGWFSSVEEQPG